MLCYGAHPLNRVQYEPFFYHVKVVFGFTNFSNNDTVISRGFKPVTYWTKAKTYLYSWIFSKPWVKRHTTFWKVSSWCYIVHHILRFLSPHSGVLWHASIPNQRQRDRSWLYCGHQGHVPLQSRLPANQPLHDVHRLPGLWEVEPCWFPAPLWTWVPPTLVSHLCHHFSHSPDVRVAVSRKINLLKRMLRT